MLVRPLMKLSLFFRRNRWQRLRALRQALQMLRQLATWLRAATPARVSGGIPV